MDTRTATASPVPEIPQQKQGSEQVPDKISAYYSLVFPHFTFYIQTLSVTIGRRCVPNASTAGSSTGEPSHVDVDLGALKSVSRLHAKIEYDQDEDRFVLVVIGRNGAWVDGVWTASGSRAPLGERSQVQIASRTFQFVLPPPPPPEDTPSPSSHSSTNRQRSPSLDITSFSPPSSQPSNSPPPPAKAKLPPPAKAKLPPPAKAKLPPPAKAKLPPPAKAKLPPPPPDPQISSQPRLPNSNAIGRGNAKANNPSSSTHNSGNSKKRKKGDPEPAPPPPRPKPEDMPPKPPFTYAQLIYRAINAIGGKATLQEICNWIMTTFDYYRYADNSWMSSVRHNLSSGRAFMKMERCGGDRGKGFFWSLDEKYRQTFEDQEAKLRQQAAGISGGGKDGSTTGTRTGRKKDKGLPLPPPLTSTPLAMKGSPPAPIPNGSTLLNTSSTVPVTATPSTSATASTGVFSYHTHPHTQLSSAATNVSGYSGTPMSAPNPYAALTQQHGWATVRNMTIPTSSISAATPTTNGAAGSPIAPSTSTATTANASTSPQSPPVQSTQSSTVPDVSIPIIIGPIPPTHSDYSPSHPNNSAKEGYMVLHERTLILDPSVFSDLTKEMLSELERMGARAALGVLTKHMVRALKEKRVRERGGRRGRGGAPGRGGRRGDGPGGPGPGGGIGHPLKDSPFTRAPLQPKAEDSTAAQPTSINGTFDESTIDKAAASLPSAAVPASSVGVNPVMESESDDQKPALKKRKLELEPQTLVTNGDEDEEVEVV